MAFLSNYGLFLLKLISAIVGILLLVAGLIAIASKGKDKIKGRLEAKSLNDHFDELRDIVNAELTDKKAIKALKKKQKACHKKEKNTAPKNRLFVLDFNGDIRASAVNALREEINAILLTANEGDEVLMKLDSGGGLVNSYGLAASQLQRLRNANITLTVAVDKIAASGGYMMACVANKIIAAPFAIIGSIGVIAQLPNFHRYLKNKHIDFEQVMAGEYKRTLTVFGENTQEGRKKLQTEIDDTHSLFKDFIKKYRGHLDLNQIATGEHWYGQTALNLQLVDEIKTSDDFLLSAKQNKELIALRYLIKKSVGKKLAHSASMFIQQLQFFR